jgi:hypothetical protein
MALALAHHLLPTESLTVLSHLRPLPLSVSAGLGTLGKLPPLRASRSVHWGLFSVGGVGQSDARTRCHKPAEGAWAGKGSGCVVLSVCCVGLLTSLHPVSAASRTLRRRCACSEVVLGSLRLGRCLLRFLGSRALVRVCGGTSSGRRA